MRPPFWSDLIDRSIVPPKRPALTSAGKPSSASTQPPQPNHSKKHVLGELRGDLPDNEVRTIVHTAIGSVQSAQFYDSGLSPDRLGPLFTAGADAILTADGHHFSF